MGLPVFVANGLGFGIIRCTFGFPASAYDEVNKPGWYYVFIDDNMVININCACYKTYVANVGTLPSQSQSNPDLFYYVALESSIQDCPDGMVWSCEENRCVPDTGGGDCFIATAATGGPHSMEVEFLRSIRDNMLMKTSSGRKLFEDFYSRYYKFSPLIAQEMNADPSFQNLMNIAIVTPLINYYKLAVEIPMIDPLDFDKIPPQLKRHLQMVYGDLQKWLSKIPLPYQFSNLTQEEICNEVYVILNYILRDSRQRTPYLGKLKENKVLPLSLPVDKETSYTRQFVEIGLSKEEIEIILGKSEVN